MSNTGMFETVLSHGHNLSLNTLLFSGQKILSKYTRPDNQQHLAPPFPP